MEKALKEKLNNKDIIIWGARIVGIGFCRKCTKESLNVVSFIDSDKALEGKEICGVKVEQPHSLAKIIEKRSDRMISIVVAVSIKEEEIKKYLKDNKIDSVNVELIYYKEYNNVYYTVDIVSSCNLSCLSCAHSLEEEKPEGMMKIEDVRKVLNKIIRESPNCTHVSLYSWGEPLIHPQLDEIISMFHKEGIAVGISTNLSHYDFKKVEKMVKSKPDYVKISVSGYYPEAYNNTHQGGDINIVKSNLYKLSHLIEKKSLGILVDINYHLYKDNCRENMEQMKRLANELNFVLSSVYALVMPLERVIAHKEGNPDDQTKLLQNNLLVTIDEGINASESIGLNGICPFKKNQMNINADLSVPVCCLVFNRNHLVAKNYLEYELEEINSRKEKAEICAKCMELNLPQYNMGFNKDRWADYAKQKEVTDKGCRSIEKG